MMQEEYGIVLQSIMSFNPTKALEIDPTFILGFLTGCSGLLIQVHFG